MFNLHHHYTLIYLYKRILVLIMFCERYKEYFASQDDPKSYLPFSRVCPRPVSESGQRSRDGPGRTHIGPGMVCRVQRFSHPDHRRTRARATIWRWGTCVRQSRWATNRRPPPPPARDSESEPSSSRLGRVTGNLPVTQCLATA
jgi:hypothetical protein